MCIKRKRLHNKLLSAFIRVHVCSAGRPKAVYQDAVTVVRDLTVFYSPVFSTFAAVNYFHLEKAGSTAGC